MTSPQILRRLRLALVTGASAVLTLSCTGSPESPMEAVVKQNTSPALMLAGSAAPASLTDSIALVNAFSRAVALALQDPALRRDFTAAFGRSTAREHKLHLQRFFAAAGAQSLRRIEQRNAIPAGGLSVALSRLPEMEMYLPVKAQRLAWTGDSTVLVTALLYSDRELKEGKTFPAYSIDGSERWLNAAAPPSQPVIVVIPRESSFGINGESGPGSAGPMPTECDPTVFFCEGESGGPPPTDPCAPGPGAYVGICRVNIGYIDQYEGWPRGSPEASIQMFAVNSNGTGFQQLSCLNEDRGGVEYYDQDVDIWEGNATAGDSATVAAAIAAGKKVTVAVWEDDTGSKCNFSNASGYARAILDVLFYGGSAACAVAFTQINYNRDPKWWTWATCAVGQIAEWIAQNDDDLIGMATQPATPASQWPILRPVQSSSFPINAGTIYVKSQSH